MRIYFVRPQISNDAGGACLETTKLGGLLVHRHSPIGNRKSGPSPAGVPSVFYRSHLTFAVLNIILGLPKFSRGNPCRHGFKDQGAEHAMKDPQKNFHDAQ